MSWSDGPDGGAIRATQAMKPILGAFAIVLLGHQAPAFAQDSEAYIGAGGFVSIQGSHRQGSAPSLPTTGAGGTTIGVLEAGVFVSL